MLFLKVILVFKIRKNLQSTFVFFFKKLLLYPFKVNKGGKFLRQIFNFRCGIWGSSKLTHNLTLTLFPTPTITIINSKKNTCASWTSICLFIIFNKIKKRQIAILQLYYWIRVRLIFTPKSFMINFSRKKNSIYCKSIFAVNYNINRYYQRTHDQYIE